MEKDIGDSIICFYDREKYLDLIAKPEGMVKVARICMQTLMPQCNMYILNPFTFEHGFSSVPLDDKIARRFILNGEIWENLPESIDKKWKIFDEIMDWFIGKSYQYPDQYNLFLENKTSNSLGLYFSKNDPSPFGISFEMTELNLTTTRSDFVTIQSNFVKEGFPEDIYYINEPWMESMRKNHPYFTGPKKNEKLEQLIKDFKKAGIIKAN